MTQSNKMSLLIGNLPPETIAIIMANKKAFQAKLQEYVDSPRYKELMRLDAIWAAGGTPSESDFEQLALASK